MKLQWRFRCIIRRGDDKPHVGEWCDWTDLYDGYWFHLPAEADIEFRRKPPREVVPVKKFRPRAAS